MSSELRVTGPSTGAEPAAGLTVERLRTIVQDSHLSFLIGAGTSSPFFEQLGDIENVLTRVGDYVTGYPEANLVRASLQGYFFDKVLLPNLPLLARDPAARSLIKSYSRFVSTINRILLKRRSTLLGKQANIFTTNVDLAFEVALELLEIDTNDGFSGKLRPRLDLGEYGTLRVRQGTHYEYRSEIPVVNLFRIHGSAAWRQEGDEIYFDHELSVVKKVQEAFDVAVRAGSLLPIVVPDDVDETKLMAAASGKRLDADGQAFTDAYHELSIVNPEKTKFATTVLNKTYYELIRRLANELEKENSALLVHGFSFRDEHLLDLVLRAARANPTLQVIVFCYSRGARDGMRVLFPDEQVKNNNILLVAPHEPRDGGDERKIDLDVLVDDYLTPLLSEKPFTADHVIELKLNNSSGAGSDA
ncbi:SIR2 family protein [Microbacterium petrolearium]